MDSCFDQGSTLAEKHLGLGIDWPDSVIGWSADWYPGKCFEAGNELGMLNLPLAVAAASVAAAAVVVAAVVAAAAAVVEHSSAATTQTEQKTADYTGLKLRKMAVNLVCL